MRRVLCVMDLPPPIHGMSLMNEMIYKQLRAEEALDVDFALLNTAPKVGAHLILKFANRLCSFFVFFVMVLRNRPDAVYRPINGGYGQFLDILIVAICRLFRIETIAHHHSFAYINRYSVIFAVFLFIGGPRLSHVTLCEKMAYLLNSIYGVAKSRCVTLSNIFIMPVSQDVKASASRGKFTIGHMANLCYEKGTGIFLKVAQLASARGYNWNFLLAGPVTDDALEGQIGEIALQQPNLTYLGPLYDAAKYDYFSALDVFLFPSCYENEAAPLVVYEASASAVRSIVTPRGCMTEMVRDLDGYVTSEDGLDGDAVAEEVLLVLREMAQQDLAAVKLETRQKFSSQLVEGQKQWGVFIKLFSCTSGLPRG